MCSWPERGQWAALRRRSHSASVESSNHSHWHSHGFGPSGKGLLLAELPAAQRLPRPMHSGLAPRCMPPSPFTAPIAARVQTLRPRESRFAAVPVSPGVSKPVKLRAAGRARDRLRMKRRSVDHRLVKAYSSNANPHGRGVPVVRSSNHGRTGSTVGAVDV